LIRASSSPKEALSPFQIRICAGSFLSLHPVWRQSAPDPKNVVLEFSKCLSKPHHNLLIVVQTIALNETLGSLAALIAQLLDPCMNKCSCEFNPAAFLDTESPVLIRLQKFKRHSRYPGNKRNTEASDFSILLNAKNCNNNFSGSIAVVLDPSLMKKSALT
jgi:hypothetical protein